MWTYIDILKNVVFDYTPGHSREGPLEFLGDYAGYLQADAYKGYDAFFAKRLALEVACWAHTRRKCFDAQDTDPARAVEMLVLIGDLYKVEDRAKEEGLDRDQIKDLRQQESQPILLQRIGTRLTLFQRLPDLAPGMPEPPGYLPNAHPIPMRNSDLTVVFHRQHPFFSVKPGPASKSPQPTEIAAVDPFSMPIFTPRGGSLLHADFHTAWWPAASSAGLTRSLTSGTSWSGSAPIRPAG